MLRDRLRFGWWRHFRRGFLADSMAVADGQALVAHGDRMNRALAMLVALVLSGCVDHGQCLRAGVQTVSTPNYIYIPQANGTMTMLYAGQFETQQMVCEQWEFPEGRP